MPGPGGGGRSGGGGRGAGGGGSRGFSGGGGHFGGGMHHGPHHGHPRGGGWRYRPMYGGAGCLGGFLGMAFGPIFAILIVAVVLVGFVGSSVMEIAAGGSVNYDEAKLQAFADDRYAEAFSGTAYEDNLLLVFLTYDDCYSYSYIAWVGDHIAPEISDLLGDDYTELGQAMAACISDTDYTYSLDSDLARVLKGVAQKIQGLRLESSYSCQEENPNATSELINRTDLPMTEETVNQALAQFTDMTGIPCAVVVEDAEDVFGRSVAPFSVITVAVVGIVAVVVVVNLARKKKRQEESWN